MTTYKAPGVYTEEISTFPPSVAEVSTAIPAFIGCTENTNMENGKPPVPTRISTLLEYTERFGGAKNEDVTVTISGDEVTGVTPPSLEFLMFYSLDMYFKNGGGPCYIVSVGDYNSAASKADIEAGLTALKKEDEPTLIVLTDAVKLSDTDYNSLCQTALMQCKELKDRFCIFDIKDGDDGEKFRNGIGTNNLKYGAAYYPYIKTALNFPYTDDSVTVTGLSLSGDTTAEYETGINGVRIFYTKTGNDTTTTLKTIIEEGTTANIGFAIDDSVADAKKLTISLPQGTTKNPSSATPTALVNAWSSWKNNNANDAKGFDIQKAGKGLASVTPKAEFDLKYAKDLGNADAGAKYTLQEFQYDKTALYNKIKLALDQEKIVLPPSSAIAGVYASVDRDSGVWKAPANVSLNSVTGPVVRLNNADQEDLNIDINSGKSINAIRAFAGKGTIVWGARTLAGNDNEWRYISVRRLFNMVEESVQKSTAFAVFEPNTAMTWLKVRSMIEGYLDGLWREGALAGAAADQAFFVNVGLGTTMTTKDINEGRMNIEIGLAAVRPAEFIILKFSHKLQES